MLFAVAYMFEDFPHYDKVDVTPTTIKYSYKGKDITEFNRAASENSFTRTLMREQRLVISFTNAQSIEEAVKQTIEQFPLHIVAVVASPVPSP